MDLDGPKKVKISVPTPSNAPHYGLLPHPNPYVQPHINNRYIGNFMDKRETRDFRVHSEMVYNKRVRSLRGRIKGVKGVGGWGVSSDI